MKLEHIAALTTIYNSDDRQYHGIHHIYRMLSDLHINLAALEAEMGIGGLVTRVEEAIWFHDAIYIPGSAPGYSEQRSASLYKSSTNHCFHEIWDAIMMTAYHHTDQTEALAAMPPTNRFVCQSLLDIDLIGLADPWDDYRATTNDIMLEYANVTGSKEFDEGRVKWITAMLSRPHIYYYNHFRDRYEKAARSNLANELRMLA